MVDSDVFIHQGADVYRKVCSGEPIDEDELRIGIRHFGLLYRLLEALGERFSFPARECRRVHDVLCGFRATGGLPRVTRQTPAASVGVGLGGWSDKLNLAVNSQLCSVPLRVDQLGHIMDMVPNTPENVRCLSEIVAVIQENMAGGDG